MAKKFDAARKNSRKSTYPPPADGLCVRFLCKSRCSANEPAAQARRGALQAIGRFTECKVLQGNAVQLHSNASGAHGKSKAGVPGFIGRQLIKRGFRCVFKNAHILSQAGICCTREEGELPTSQAGQGL